MDPQAVAQREAPQQAQQAPQQRGLPAAMPPLAASPTGQSSTPSSPLPTCPEGDVEDAAATDSDAAATDSEDAEAPYHTQVVFTPDGQPPLHVEPYRLFWPPRADAIITYSDPSTGSPAYPEESTDSWLLVPLIATALDQGHLYPEFLRFLESESTLGTEFAVLREAELALRRSFASRGIQWVEESDESGWYVPPGQQEQLIDLLPRHIRRSLSALRTAMASQAYEQQLQQREQQQLEREEAAFLKNLEFHGGPQALSAAIANQDPQALMLAAMIEELGKEAEAAQPSSSYRSPPLARLRRKLSASFSAVQQQQQQLHEQLLHQLDAEPHDDGDGERAAKMQRRLAAEAREEEKTRLRQMEAELADLRRWVQRLGGQQAATTSAENVGQQPVLQPGTTAQQQPGADAEGQPVQPSRWCSIQ